MKDTIHKTLWGLAHEKLLLAHSGGLDSSVLAHLLVSENIPFSIAHCNFQLRGEESDQDAQFVKIWSESHRIPFYLKCFDTLQYKKKNKLSTQETARILRYEWFKTLQKTNGFTVLLTAHHLNDQLETFLMYATRGTGLKGLLGIPESDWIQRPLLSVTKKELYTYAKAMDLKWREDSSNKTDNYLRNELRHHVVEPLLSIQPQALTNFNKTLKHLTTTEAFVQSQLDQLKKQIFNINSDTTHIKVRDLEQLSQKEFCIHHWFSPYGFDASEVVKLLVASKGKGLYSSTHRLIRERDTIVLTSFAAENKEEFHLTLGQTNCELPIPLRWESFLLKEKEIWEPYQAALDKNKLKKNLTLRKYKKGDYFYPTGMQGKKLISKFFKDEKFSTLEKEAQWLLCCGEDVVWVVGKRCDKRYAAKKTGNEILLMTLEL
jgi:tRNA(Ile)-lysidine synthase